MNFLKWHCLLSLLSWFVFLSADPRISLGGINEDLIQAIRHVKAEAVEDLLARGADVNAKTKTGDTALKIATRNGDILLGEMLRRAEAK